MADARGITRPLAKYSLYANSGQLTYVGDGRTGKTTNYFYLGAGLVASQEKVTSTGATTVMYQHTDALGSPVAVTNQSRVVVERSEYEPYGQQIFNRAETDGRVIRGMCSIPRRA